VGSVIHCLDKGGSVWVCNIKSSLLRRFQFVTPQLVRVQAVHGAHKTQVEDMVTEKYSMFASVVKKQGAGEEQEMILFGLRYPYMNVSRSSWLHAIALEGDIHSLPVRRRCCNYSRG
jgi:hypothetical protein